MKIHIIGGSGTGKSYIARKISREYAIPHCDLDDIFWDNTSASYGTKTPKEKRAELLSAVLAFGQWVIEGVYYDWLAESFRAADRIFIIKAPPLVFNFRIIRRFLKRKLGIEKSKKESLKSLIDLLKWTKNYQKNNIPKILEFLKPYADKVIVVKKSDDVFEYVHKLT